MLQLRGKRVILVLLIKNFSKIYDQAFNIEFLCL